MTSPTVQSLLPRLPALLTRAFLAGVAADLITHARRLAPVDLAHRPLYLLWARDVTPAASPHILGCISTAFDGLVEHLTPNQWRGPGSTMFLNEIALTAQEIDTILLYGDLIEPRKLIQLFLRQFRRAAQDVVMHELGHYLDTLPVQRAYAPLSAVEAAELQARLTARLAESSPDPREDEHHNSRWIRACIHLHHRAGARSDLAEVCNTQVYHLSAAGIYAAALGDEPARLIDRSFTDILATQPPSPFTDLFTADCAARSARRLAS